MGDKFRLLELNRERKWWRFNVFNGDDKGSAGGNRMVYYVVYLVSIFQIFGFFCTIFGRFLTVIAIFWEKIYFSEKIKSRLKTVKKTEKKKQKKYEKKCKTAF